MERLFTPMLQDYIAAKLPKGKSHLVAEYANTLITPAKISRIFQERKAFFDIIAFIRKNKYLKKLVLRNFSQATLISPKLERLIDSYLARYDWMPVLVNNPPWKYESLSREILHFIKTNKPLAVQGKRLGDNYDPQVFKKAKKYLAQLKPPAKIKHLIAGLQAMAFLRTEDYAVMSQSAYYVIPIYTEIAKRLGLTYYDLKEFLPEEIVRHLKQKNNKIAKKDLQDRLRLSVHILYKNKRYFYTGRQALVYEKIITTFRKEKTALKEFKGLTAQPGKIKGRVRLILNPADLAKIQKGDIAVSSFLSSMFASWFD